MPRQQIKTKFMMGKNGSRQNYLENFYRLILIFALKNQDENAAA